MSKLYRHNAPFKLESGEVLPSLEIAYDTFGELNEAKDNVIWVCHALTANSDVADWWPHTVEQGKFLDPERYFIVCANFLGSHYGTTSPLTVNPATGKKWYYDFPRITVRDMVACHQLLAKELGIERVKLLIGSSIGGFQCMEWAIMEPEFMENLALIATTTYSEPWAAAFNESQRMAIRLDPSWGEERDDAGLDGMAVARSIALISYRGGAAYNATQQELSNPLEASFDRRAHSYQQYQGEKLRRRFNALSYYRLSEAVDSHNIARGRGTIAEALSRIKARTLVVAISSDILFPVEAHTPLREHIADVEYHLIESEFGHDGFLVEHEKLNTIIQKFINR
ncbi:MAG: homoserine O-acetyltransferase [Alistipes sp.]|nr:homoserine O-acetyltransferase [Rikenellaceae bacterium]MBR3590930.1 homoserine O-acetyltransferase [Alistipes sp.]